MVLYKKILIFFILILSIYILLRLLHKRQILIDSQNIIKVDISNTFPEDDNIEGYTNEISVQQDLKLSNYFIKSSYNSCYDCNAIVNPFNVNVLKSVLSKGYRFIDMEICKISTETEPIQVCLNLTYKDETQQASTTTFPLTSAINTIITYGLTQNISGAKNYNEPLFIHFRLKHSNLTTTQEIQDFYNEVQTILYNTTDVSNRKDLGNFIFPINNYYTAITPNGNKLSYITLDKIINSIKKCFIIIDTTNLNSSYTTYFTERKHIITSGFNTGSMNLYNYDDIYAKNNIFAITDISGKLMDEQNIKVDTKYNTINKTTFSISIPSKTNSDINYYPYDLVKKYGIQFATVNFSNNDEGLKKNEEIFSLKNNMTGFIPMASVIKKAATDVRSSFKTDIKTGIYISVIITIIVFLIYFFFFKTKLENFTK